LFKILQDFISSPSGMKKHIPNFITLLNLASGFAGILFLLRGHTQWAFLMVPAAALFDFLDGMAARLLKAGSALGKDLDSLADLVSFGVLPALLICSELYAGDLNQGMQQPAVIRQVIFASPVLLVLAAAVRLARFNHDTRQLHSFLGLPTPANGLFFASLAFVFHLYPDHGAALALSSPLAVLALVLLFSWLMVSELPMFSLKISSVAFRGNEIRFVFVGISAILLILLHWFALPLIIGLYILMSLVQAGFRSNKN